MNEWVGDMRNRDEEKVKEKIIAQEGDKNNKAKGMRKKVQQ
jgi:hypothetical protein